MKVVSKRNQTKVDCGSKVSCLCSRLLFPSDIHNPYRVLNRLNWILEMKQMAAGISVGFELDKIYKKAILCMLIERVYVK